MTPPCTIAATAQATNPLFFSTCSAVLRLPPLDSPLSLSRSLSLSSIATSIMTSNQHHHHHTSSSTTTDLDAVFKHKKAIRTRVRKDLKGMDPIQRSLEDSAIQNIVLEAPWFKSCKRLCAYISCSALREVDTSKVLAEILQISSKDGHTQIGKKLYVPRVEDKNSHMRMLNISSITDLIANSMNILEPASVDGDGIEREDVMHSNEPVDLFLLPGLAFDKSGRRLGRGGGYYDTFLTKYRELAKERNWEPPLLVALSYSLQILDDGVIPVTPSDVPVDALVLPSGVIPITPAALERCS